MPFAASRDTPDNAATRFHEPDHPEVMIQSNIRQDGKPVGLGDAGQGWHTDMSHSEMIALTAILHAPHSDIRRLKSMSAADLSEPLERFRKERLLLEQFLDVIGSQMFQQLRSLGSHRDQHTSTIGW